MGETGVRAEEIGARPSRARRALLRRLADVVSLPASRINVFERSVVGDLLVDVLRPAPVEERRRVAQRLAPLGELPDTLKRLLLRDEPEVARALLEDCAALSDADLIGCARDAGLEHRLMMASRRGLSEAVTETLLSWGEEAVIVAVLRNDSARLSQSALEGVIALSRGTAALCDLLLRRAELRPSGAYVMFWWCGPTERRIILQRFAVSREVMQSSVEDVFAMAAEEGWNDPVARKALQFIERRQRNRAAIEKSPYADLEAAVAAAASGGLTRDLVSEIGYLSGIKPLTSAKIMGDAGGEPLAILCKATGLTRRDLSGLWRAMRRPETTADGQEHPDWRRVQTTYEMLAVDRAQTVLRYWNWTLSSALTPTLLRAIREGDGALIDEYSAPERAALLALAENFGR
ncbi:DUF2336 domain-containing protein [Brevundimonas sp. 3P9-tot-E]|jgi:uncharacterized protein (DUF2336 family)|uniref:DUF2336 domain-containing protein n=1 Tax=Brevundimonas TaxID=41275 RepID=UPI001908FA62|nr:MULTISPECIES: DUF2336 domain-containing protein [Brevundimonas]MBK1970927.1 DUF2336 domain-containing protein [Brevundimonas diminuta]MBK1977163.1 DUF2336 domain-containing protein [Brevundimonas diminuta]MDM8354466.1 DUF2336 domain-containing protein [Brevundimonas diminuta]